METNNFDLSSFNVTPKQEETQTLLSKIAPFPYRNMGNLQKGFAFIYRSNIDKDWANEDTELYLHTSFQPDTSDRPKKFLKHKILFDQVLVFEKMEEFEYDFCTYTTLFFTSKDKIYCFDFMGTKEELIDARLTIQGLVPLDELLYAKQTLVGKTVPIAISNWMMQTKYGIEEYESWNGKIEQVTITNVGYGEFDKPIRLVFKTKDNKEYFVDVCISSTNTTNYVEDINDRTNGFIDDI